MKNGLKNLQTEGCNGARTVDQGVDSLGYDYCANLILGSRTYGIELKQDRLYMDYGRALQGMIYQLMYVHCFA